MLGPSLPRLPVSTTPVRPLSPPFPPCPPAYIFSAFSFFLHLGPIRPGEVTQNQTYHLRTELFLGEYRIRLKSEAGLPPEGQLRQLLRLNSTESDHHKGVLSPTLRSYSMDGWMDEGIED